MATQTPTQAVVIGGSIAGLWTARVLTNHFDRVIIVDRDTFPTTPSVRKGVPQARHLHVLLAQGMRVMEELFPGMTAELAAAGAPEVDWRNDCTAYTVNGYVPRSPSALKTRTSSRALLEWLIRQRLAANPKIQFVPEHDVIGLLHDTDKGQVTGIRLRRREQGQLGEVTELPAQLTVDASGRDSKTPEWLQTLGYGETAVTTINSFLGYASRWYRRPANAPEWKSLFTFTDPPRQPRNASLQPTEDDQWVVTLVGAARAYPPTDEAGFLEFAKQIGDGTLYEAIKEAEPLTPIAGYRRTENVLRHYERFRRWPKGFAVLGDAVCAFNPVYGQGMTVSANAAVCLDRCLRQAKGDLTSFTARFQRQLAKVNAGPWLLATSEDLRFPTTEGAKPNLMTRLTHRYMEQVLALLPESVPVADTFVAVLHLVEPPTALFRPRVLGPVLKRVLFSRTRKPAAGQRAGRVATT